MQVTDEQKQIIVEGISRGLKVLEACDEAGISYSDYRLAKSKDPLFDKNIQLAREDSAHLAVDELKTITDLCEDLVDTTAARIKSENIKWSASKAAPQVYGDALNINLNQTLDIGPALLAAQARVIPLLGSTKQKPVEREVEPIASGDTNAATEAALKGILE